MRVLVVYICLYSVEFVLDNWLMVRNLLFWNVCVVVIVEIIGFLKRSGKY